MWFVLTGSQINEEGTKKNFRGFWNHEYDEKDFR